MPPTQPPSTTYCWLVHALASSEARNTVNFAISSGTSLLAATTSSWLAGQDLP